LPLHAIWADHCTCGSQACASPGKHPFARYVPRGVHDATTDPDTVAYWFSEHPWLNYGIRTDGLLVVDVDARNHGLEKWRDMSQQPTRAVPHSWAVLTGGGGTHLFFKGSPELRGGVLETGIDLKAKDGYVVGPYSKHVSGKQYLWSPQCSPNDAPLADAPEWLLAVIRTRTFMGRVTSVDEWRKTARTKVTEGARHGTLLRLAGYLLCGTPPDTEVVRDLLLGWNAGACVPPLPEKEVIRIIEGVAARQRSKPKTPPGYLETSITGWGEITGRADG
jgi:hypothetical protein